MNTAQTMDDLTTDHSQGTSTESQVSRLNILIDTAQLELAHTLSNIKISTKEEWKAVEKERKQLQQLAESMKEQQENNDRMAREIKEQQEYLDLMAKKMELCFTRRSSQVKLNIGGCKYTTSMLTITRDRDSIFGAMFSGAFHTDQDQETEEHFIDRDGSLFHIILKHLRGYDVSTDISSLTSTEKDMLMQDVGFYQILSMFPLFSDKPISVITVPSRLEQAAGISGQIQQSPSVQSVSTPVLTQAGNVNTQQAEVNQYQNIPVQVQHQQQFQQQLYEQQVQQYRQQQASVSPKSFGKKIRNFLNP